MESNAFLIAVNSQTAPHKKFNRCSPLDLPSKQLLPAAKLEPKNMVSHCDA